MKEETKHKFKKAWKGCYENYMIYRFYKWVNKKYSIKSERRTKNEK